MDAREKILKTAAHLFSEQGYRATSLAQVARAAQVSKALILWHFNSKERLFQVALQHFLAPYEILDQGLEGLSESDQLERLINDYYEFIAENLYSVKFLLGQVVRDEENTSDLMAQVRQLYRVYCDLLMSILERGKKRGLFAAEIQPQAEAALVLAVLNGLLIQRLVEGEEAENSRDLLQHFQRALRVRLNPATAPSDAALSSLTEMAAPSLVGVRASRQ